MDRGAFEALVAKAVANLPEEFLARLDNVDVVVSDVPTRRQLRKARITSGTLLGLYEGVPQTQRGVHYGLVPPDKITIFQMTIEDKCKNERDIYTEIERVLRHEIAHHFGISDERLREMGRQ